MREGVQMSHRVAVVQHPPVMLNRTETLERGVRLSSVTIRAPTLSVDDCSGRAESLGCQRHQAEGDHAQAVHHRGGVQPHG
jgi:hypothetical protein